MEIKAGGKYRIKGKSKYFMGKYGTTNPIITIEDTDIKVFGCSWATREGNPCCILFGMRAGMENLPALNDTIYYGKIKVVSPSGARLGELVCESELEII